MSDVNHFGSTISHMCFFCEQFLMVQLRLGQQSAGRISTGMAYLPKAPSIWTFAPRTNQMHNDIITGMCANGSGSTCKKIWLMRRLVLQYIVRSCCWSYIHGSQKIGFNHNARRLVDWTKEVGNCRYYGLMLDEDMMSHIKFLCSTMNALLWHMSIGFLVPKKCCWKPPFGWWWGEPWASRALKQWAALD